MSGRIYTDGHEIDGSWVLRVYVTDLNVERSLRVKGELHIGGVMLRLVEDLDIAMDWSDHALWWPARNHWLTRTRSTLDQYGVAADAILHFTPMHKTLRVQLPDMRYLDCRVDFSVKTFNAVINLCKELGIRHPEELSFCKPLEPSHLKHNHKDMRKEAKKPEGQRNGFHAAADTNTFIAASQSPRGSTGSLDQSSPAFMCAPVTPNNRSSTPVGSPLAHTGTWKRNNNALGFGSTGSFNANNSSMSLEALNGGLTELLVQSPAAAPPELRSKLLRPRSLLEKARMNVAWLDSSLSIMEQQIREYDTLRLRFKFYSFYDLNPKTDAVRINMIYEQAKWQLLAEEIDCTEEEMLMFAALQVQVNLQAGVPQKSPAEGNGAANNSGLSPAEDDIDAALTDLQVSLEGSSLSNGPSDITQVPELCDYLRFFKPKRFTLKAFKRYWFTCRDLQLRLYKSREDAAGSDGPAHVVNLRGCEVTPDVHLSQARYGIRLEVPSAEGMTEMWIRCDNEQQYAKWMAACRLAAKGRTLADASYESEVNGIVAFLQLQRPAPAPAINPNSLGDIVPEDYVAPRFAKKFKGKVSQRLLPLGVHVQLYSCLLPAADPEDPRGPRQRQGPAAGRGQAQLHQGLAVAARVRNFPLRRQVHRKEQGRVARHREQQTHADGPPQRGSHQDLEIQHDEGMERQLGGQAHDGAVRGGEHNLRVPVGRLQGTARIHRGLHLPLDALEGSQPDVERRNVPQAHRRLGLVRNVPTSPSNTKIPILRRPYFKAT